MVGVGAGGVQSLGLGVVLEVENLVSGREVEVECWRGSWRLDQGEAHRGVWLVGRDVRRNGGGGDVEEGPPWIRRMGVGGESLAGGGSAGVDYGLG